MTRPDAPERQPSADRRLSRWLPDLAPTAPAEPGSGERRAWRLLGRLVLAFVLLAGAVSTGANLIQRETSHERMFFERIARVEIDSGPARVSVLAAGTDRVLVAERVGWALSRPTVSEHVENDTLSISVGCPGGRARSLFGCAVNLEIQVPPNTEVHSRNSSGRTEILGIAGAVSASTDRGQVELTRVSGRVRAVSGSGQIIGNGLASSAAELFSSSGQITLQYDRAPLAVTARTASGNFILHLPADGSRYRTDLSTADGRQEIDTSVPDQESSRVLDITSGSGRVTIDRDNER
ncbi:DUF4097 family beta strand repeat-containing protein [Kitasatospora sp. NPDC088391]|uniref:DUF4097 family beta strand repeat-containing protein n=1 Tax=Kitasatospora sp. NPDC088391 TaxID=3364074 RepID=UPI0037F1C801